MSDDKKRDDKLMLDVPFDEALARFAQTDPEEARAIKHEGMSDDTIEGLIDAFEACSQRTPEGSEFWFARDLQRLLGYEEWRNFEKVLEKAEAACDRSGNATSDHFVGVNRMVDLGSGAKREVQDLMLSRYACYLAAQNGDARKRPVAFAQTYFAIQTRRQELADQGNPVVVVPMSEDEKRVYLRNQIKEHNKYLSSAAKSAGVVTPQEFAIFHSHGYQGLYGKTVAEIKKHKKLPKSTDILDRMGSTELAANFFRVTQTEEKLRKDNIQGATRAYRTHYEVGRQVRDAMLKISGIAPEDLPAVDGIKRAERRLLAAPSRAVEKAPPPAAPEPIQEPAPEPIDLNKDLWKYALLAMVQRPQMEIGTADLIAALPSYIAVPSDASEANESRKDSKFSQLVRNLKSHKTSSTSFIARGYAEDIPNGFKATQKGRDFVLAYFGSRLKL